MSDTKNKITTTVSTTAMLAITVGLIKSGYTDPDTKDRDGNIVPGKFHADTVKLYLHTDEQEFDNMTARNYENVALAVARKMLNDVPVFPVAIAVPQAILDRGADYQPPKRKRV